MLILGPATFSPIVLMHIPDGFLALSIALACWAVTVLLEAVAVRRTQGELGERQVPLMGVMAAFIFAAQMINFPVAGGTSGHLLGGALAAITLGPWPAMLVMASVIGVQGLLFQDGGLVVMGANILNMGLLGVLVAYGLYRTVAGAPPRVRLAVTAVAAWMSVMVGALAASLELWLSGTARLEVVLPAMLGVHALIGLGESLITVAALSFIWRTRPDLVQSQAQGGLGWAVAGIAIALAAVLLAPFASVDPDGLETVAERAGFSHLAQSPAYSIFPDYTVPFLGGEAGTIVAGVVGVVVVAGVIWALSSLIRRSAGAPQGRHSH